MVENDQLDAISPGKCVKNNFSCDSETRQFKNELTEKLGSLSFHVHEQDDKKVLFSIGQMSEKQSIHYWAKLQSDFVKLQLQLLPRNMHGSFFTAFIPADF